MGKPKHSQKYVDNFLKERNILLLSEYKSVMGKIKTKCLICGYIWFPVFNNIKSNKRGCPECGKIKAKQTFLKKYGVEHPLKRKDILQKQKNTNLERYGVENVSQNKKIAEKRERTFYKKFGENTPLKNDEIKKKIKQTNLERYGVEHPLQREDFLNKQTKTNLDRYGVERPCQNIKIARKNAKSQGRSYVLKHWKTNEEIVCRGSYEKGVIEYLNKNRINYWWQEYSFETPILTPKGKRSFYHPDLYLPDKKLWIEIKGYFWEGAEEKWNWFHDRYPNSELWNKNKLKEMRIL